MKNAELNVVTGAFSHSGKYITKLLLSQGEKVRTLTGKTANILLRKKIVRKEIEVFPFNFDDLYQLRKSLEGASILYNTYWIRFPYREMTFEKAVENSKNLIRAAKEAGIKRIVHFSITNSSEGSAFPYFRGKAEVERAIIESNLSYAIIRPTVIFGPEAILINNIAWLLRKFPIFAIFGSGDYKIQPVFVEDVAEMAVKAGEENENLIFDTAGPEIFSFEELVKLIAQRIQSRAKIFHLKPEIVHFLGRLIGFLVKDVVVTRDEVNGLMANLLVSKDPPSGKTKFSQWLDENSEKIGRKYFSELAQHYR